VSIRTLRYYDKVSLLSPSGYTEVGYRLYTDADFLRLQQILALKILGFSLKEIQQCLQAGPRRLKEVLALQRAMMQERREQLDAIIQAIDEAEKLLQANRQDREAIISMIRVMRMQQTSDWRKRHFNEEQLKKMEEWEKKYYTEEHRQKLAERRKSFTEEDQRAAEQKWREVLAELRRLVSAGAWPGSPEAKALAQQWQDLIRQFTQGDEGIGEGLGNMYNDFSQIPKVVAPQAFPYSEEEATFLQKALDP